MIVRLGFKNIIYRPLNTVLSIILLAAAVAIISLLILLQQQFENKFSENIDGVDLVLGAKGSPLQLILSSVYQMDTPTGNINLDAASVWMKNPFVKSAIPLAFGDNYRGFKIVGTTPAYLTKYGAEIISGKMFTAGLEVVVGHEVATKLQIKPGDVFFGAHGDVVGGEVHENYPYRVVGILSPTGKVIDNLIIATLSSVWEVHQHESAVSQDEHENSHLQQEAQNDHEHESASHQHTASCNHEESPKEITAVLLQMRNKMALVTWPRLIAQNTNMQVASPAIEVNRLFTLFGVGISALQYLAYGIMLISGISIFIALYNTLKERKYEFAIMRINGASASQLLLLVICESLFLCIAGFVLGLFCGRLSLLGISSITSNEYKMTFNPFEIVYFEEGLLFLLTIFTGLIAAIIPAVKAYRLNISKTLANA